jgi:hypothetical protein
MTTHCVCVVLCVKDSCLSMLTCIRSRTPGGMVFPLFAVNTDWSVYLWYGLFAIVMTALFLANFVKRLVWYQLIDSELILKMMELLKTAIVIFLFLDPGSLTTYTCSWPPVLFLLNNNLLGSGPASTIPNLAFWAAVGVNVTADQSNAIIAANSAVDSVKVVLGLWSSGCL